MYGAVPPVSSALKLHDTLETGDDNFRNSDMVFGSLLDNSNLALQQQQFYNKARKVVDSMKQ